MIDVTDLSGAELVDVLLTVLGSVAVTVVGLGIELAGLLDLLAGELAIGAWEAAIGLLALYVGVYVLAYQRVWPVISRESGQQA